MRFFNYRQKRNGKNMNNSNEIQQQKFKEILFNAYKLGNEVENINLTILIEEIQQQLITVMIKNK